MSGLIAQLLNGVQYGLLLFLISSGLTLIFGVMGVINLAHGSLFMIGAYIAFVVSGATGSLWLSLPVAVLGGVAFGALLERVLFRRFYHREHLDQVLLTFALILLFEEGRSILLGNDFHSVLVPAALDVSVPIVGGFSYSAYRLAVLVACLLVAGAMFLAIERTRVGSAIRAAAEKPEMVDLLGLDARRIHMLVFAVGTALAMLAGALAAPLRGVEPFMGLEALGIAFVVVVVGGIGSFTGALLGGLLIGVVQSVMSSLWPEGARLMIYAAMALVLLARPAGLLGRA